MTVEKADELMSKDSPVMYHGKKYYIWFLNLLNKTADIYDQPVNYSGTLVGHRNVKVSEIDGIK